MPAIPELTELVKIVNTAINEGNIAVILLIIIVLAYKFIRPNGGDIISDFFPNTGASSNAVPAWYSRSFWLVECIFSVSAFISIISKFLAILLLFTTILIASLAILWFCRSNLLQGLDRIRTCSRRINLSQRFLILSITIFVVFIVLWNNFLPRDQKETKLSFGDTILINKEDIFSNKETVEWKQKCRENWQKKMDGIDNYKKYIKDEKKYIENGVNAFGFFNSFVDSLICPNEPEAQIYRNNTYAKLVDKKPIEIAVSVPISTALPDSQEVLRGVALAQYEINQREEKLYGRKLLVGIANEGDSNQLEDLANFFVNRSSVVGVIGHLSSDTAIKAGKVYNGYPVAISPTSTADRNENFQLSPYVFRTAPNNTAAAQSLVDYISKNHSKITKIVILYRERDSYNKSFKDVFTKAFEEKGGQVINDEDRCNFDFNTVNKNNFDINWCLTIAQKKADALLIITNLKNVNRQFVKDLILKNNQSDKRLPLFAGDVMYDQSFLIPEAEGMVVAIPWHRSETNNLSKFEELAEGMFGKWQQVSWRTAMAYDATQAMIKGLEEASQRCSFMNLGLDLGRQRSACLRKELKNVLSSDDFKADGALGKETVQFKNGDRKQDDCANQSLDYQIGVLVKVKNNQFVPERQFQRRCITEG